MNHSRCSALLLLSVALVAGPGFLLAGCGKKAPPPQVKTAEPDEVASADAPAPPPAEEPAAPTPAGPDAPAAMPAPGAAMAAPSVAAPAPSAGAASPEELVKNFAEAAKNEDWGTVYNQFTDEGQSRMAFMAMMTVVGIAQSTGDEGAKGIMQKYGIDPAAIMDAMKGMGRPDPAAIDQIALQMGSQLQQKRDFTMDGMAYMMSVAKARGSPMPKLGELSDLQINGDTATGRSVGGPPMTFKKVNGAWLIDSLGMGQASRAN